MFNMKKLTERRVQHDAGMLGYKPYAGEPYAGGAGPSMEQSNTNNEALLRLLTVSGVDAKIVRDSARDPLEGEYTAVKVLDTECVYDRWGFCTQQAEIDQVGIWTAYSYLYDMFESNKIGISMQEQ